MTRQGGVLSRIQGLGGRSSALQVGCWRGPGAPAAQHRGCREGPRSGVGWTPDPVPPGRTQPGKLARACSLLLGPSSGQWLPRVRPLGSGFPEDRDPVLCTPEDN